MGRFEALSVLLLCSSVFAQNPGSLTVTFQSTFGVFSNHISATCRVSNFNSASDSTATFSWRHNNSFVQEGGRIEVTRMLNSGVSILDIEDLVYDDAGVYSCAVQLNNPNFLLEETATLQIATPLLVSAEPEQEATVGGPAELRCTVQSFPLPRLTWIRVESNGGAETELLEQDREFDDDFGVYRIANVTESDAGDYICRGEYLFANEELPITLIVLVPPVITSPFFTASLQEKGSEFTADCDASGMRPPIYSWSFNGVVISSPSSGRFSVDQNTGVLTILELTFSDTGSYTCVASNSIGTDQQANSIVVFGSPEILTPTITSFVTAPTGLRFELQCPFLAFPQPVVSWERTPTGASREQIQTSTGSGFQLRPANATLVFLNPQPSDGGTYSCRVMNVHGVDSRMFQVLIIGLPNSPRDLQVEPVSGNATTAVELDWDPPNEITTINPVDEYVVELKFDGMDSEQEILTEAFPSNVTSTVLSNLLPGTSYDITVRARNLAGLSQPSNLVTHTTQASAPELSFFRATALADGRSLLLEWELLHDGGPSITAFTVEIRGGDIVVELSLNITDSSFLVSSLEPDTQYAIAVTVANGVADLAFETSAATPLAPPSKPSTPEIVLRTTQSFTITFSVLFGSSEITRFLINITDQDGSETQTDVAVTDLQYVEELVELRSAAAGDAVVGYEARLVILGLENRRSYVFQVAAVNSVGTGEFSDTSNSATLDRIIYYIIAGVVGGIILVVIVIMVVILAAVCRKRILKERRKLAISTYDQPPETAKTTDSFVLQTPPAGHSFNRYSDPSLDKNAPPPPTSYGHLNNSDIPNNEEFESHVERMSSPFYNTLSGYHPDQGDIKFVDIDAPGLDEVDNALDVGGSKESRHEAQANGQLGSSHHSKLQTSLNNLTLRSDGSGGHDVGAAARHYPESVVSEKAYLATSPPNLQQASMSVSTPAMNRDSTDMDTLPPSYMTDV